MNENVPPSLPAAPPGYAPCPKPVGSTWESFTTGGVNLLLHLHLRARTVLVLPVSAQHYLLHSPQRPGLLPDSFLLHQHNLLRKLTQAQQKKSPVTCFGQEGHDPRFIYKTLLPTFIEK